MVRLSVLQSPSIDTHILDIDKVYNIRIKGTNLRGFQTYWKKTLSELNPAVTPGEEVLEMLYRRNIENHPKLAAFFDAYNVLPADSTERSYEALLAMVDQHLQRQQYKAVLAEHQKQGHRVNTLGKGGGKAKAKAKPKKTKGTCNSRRETGECEKRSQG